MSVTAYGADEQTAQDTAVTCERRVNALEPALSRTREASDIYRLNHATGRCAR